MDIWQSLYTHLEETGFKVYSIGQHQGACKEPYIVIKRGYQSSNQGAITGYNLIDVMCYFPIGEYSKLSSFRNLVIDSLKTFTNARFTGNITEEFIDENKKAYTFSTTLQSFKRINH